jgi:hypothetical protein
MGTLIIRHKVKDYGEWRPFDRHAVAQKSGGLTNPRVFRSCDNDNEVVFVRYRRHEKAKDLSLRLTSRRRWRGQGS